MFKSLFRNKVALADLIILEAKAQGNIVLGRSFFPKCVGGLVNVKYGLYILFPSSIAGFTSQLKKNTCSLEIFYGRDVGNAFKKT